MHKTRLRILAKHLRTVKPSRFAISWWKCGTTACAIGHAGTTCKPLMDLGFRIVTIGHYAHVPQFNDLKSWEATCEFFDLSTRDAHRLFDGSHYGSSNVSALAVADRIDAFVKEKRDKRKPKV